MRSRRSFEAAVLVEDLVHLVRWKILAEFGVDLVVSGQQPPNLDHAFLDVAENRLAGIEDGFL